MVCSSSWALIIYFINKILLYIYIYIYEGELLIYVFIFYDKQGSCEALHGSRGCCGVKNVSMHVTLWLMPSATHVLFVRKVVRSVVGCLILGSMLNHSWLWFLQWSRPWAVGPESFLSQHERVLLSIYSISAVG